MKFDDIEGLFDWVGGARPFENAAYLNRKTGESYITSELGDSDELPDDIDENDDILDVPHPNDLDLGRRLVFDFVGNRIPDEFDRVDGFFRRAGAYRRFRALLDEKGLLDDWHKYEADQTRAAILEWCNENGVVVED